MSERQVEDLIREFLQTVPPGGTNMLVESAELLPKGGKAKAKRAMAKRPMAKKAPMKKAAAKKAMAKRSMAKKSPRESLGGTGVGGTSVGGTGVGGVVVGGESAWNAFQKAFAAINKDMPPKKLAKAASEAYARFKMQGGVASAERPSGFGECLAMRTSGPEAHNPPFSGGVSIPNTQVVSAPNLEANLYDGDKSIETIDRIRAELDRRAEGDFAGGEVGFVKDMSDFVEGIKRETDEKLDEIEKAFAAAASVSKDAVAKKRGGVKRPDTPYMQALRIYNKFQPRWSIPSKGSDGYQTVMAIKAELEKPE